MWFTRTTYTDTRNIELSLSTMEPYEASLYSAELVFQLTLGQHMFENSPELPSSLNLIFHILIPHD